MTKADQALLSVYADLGLSKATDAEKFTQIYKIIEALAELNKAEKISVSTTGTISERLCELALESTIPSSYFRLTEKNIKWLGDYSIIGYPLNVVVSVKSFKAKERLLASGTGNLLAPTLGFGLFDDSTEFSAARLKSYKLRGFLGIYMPVQCFQALDDAAKSIVNNNGRSIVRCIDQFPADIANAMVKVSNSEAELQLVSSVKL